MPKDDPPAHWRSSRASGLTSIAPSPAGSTEASSGLGGAITGAVKAPEGDFRDWDAIRQWGAEIAAALDRPKVAA